MKACTRLQHPSVVFFTVASPSCRLTMSHGNAVLLKYIYYIFICLYVLNTCHNRKLTRLLVSLTLNDYLWLQPLSPSKHLLCTSHLLENVMKNSLVWQLQTIVTIITAQVGALWGSAAARRASPIDFNVNMWKSGTCISDRHQHRRLTNLTWVMVKFTHLYTQKVFNS